MSKPIDRTQEIWEIFEYVRREFDDMDLNSSDYANSCLFELLRTCIINNVSEEDLLIWVSGSYGAIKQTIKKIQESPL